ncbi:hypothetical protein OUZ56_032747 [Daphnia magna]|uniref:Uncharacterized protein n=1 Tax=Daphnia magna TaxID=35525 RepID=A0ABQ9ZX02_9CRUS|nr:hypothetical protein OUZ56_032747 [Daphnia magna]
MSHTLVSSKTDTHQLNSLIQLSYSFTRWPKAATVILGFIGDRRRTLQERKTMAKGKKKADQARQPPDEDTIAGRGKNRNVQAIYQRQAEDLGKSQAQSTANDDGQGLNLQTTNAKGETTPQHSRAQDAVERDAMINKLIADNGSRRACHGLVDKLDSIYADTERLNLLAVMPNDAEEYGRQAAIQIALFTQIETAKKDVDGFIDSRADEASSMASFQPLSIRSEVLRNWTQTQEFHQKTS